MLALSYDAKSAALLNNFGSLLAQLGEFEESEQVRFGLRRLAFRDSGVGCRVWVRLRGLTVAFQGFGVVGWVWAEVRMAQVLWFCSPALPPSRFRTPPPPNACRNGQDQTG
jgi:hypothetical protein